MVSLSIKYVNVNIVVVFDLLYNLYMEPNNENSQVSSSPAPMLNASSINESSTFSNLLSRSLSHYKTRFVPLTVVSFLPFVLGFCISAIIGALYVTGNVMIGVLVSIALFIVSTIVQFAANIALIYLLKDDNTNIRNSFKMALKILKSYIWVTILSTLIIAGGTMLFILPGIIFSFWYTLAWFIVADQNLYGIDALNKSKYYVTGNFLWLLGRIFVLALFVMATTMLSSGLGSVIDSVFFADSVNIFEGLLPAVVSLFAAPFAVTFAFNLYRDLVARKGEPTAPLERGKGYVFFAILGVVATLALLAVVAAAGAAVMSGRFNYDSYNNGVPPTNGNIDINETMLNDFYIPESTPQLD